MQSEKLLQRILEVENLQEEIDALSLQIGEKKARVERIMDKEIPDMMDEAGVSEIKVEGYKVKNGIVYRSNITKANAPAAFKFLYDTNNEGIIKKNILIDEEQLDIAEKLLKAAKVTFTTELKVDNRTLGRVVRELVEAGKMNTEDMEKFSLFTQPDVKITKPKG